MIDRHRALALVFPARTFDVERSRLTRFAAAIGETDPIYHDPAAAKAAGHRDLPVPPTFFFSMNLDQSQPFWYLDALDVDLRFILHGEQSFTYHSLAYAGDVLTLHSRISDVYCKRNGALEFFDHDTEVRRDGEVVAQLRSVIVVRHQETAV